MTKGAGAQNWSNYWQGRAAQESGAALVGVGIENDAEIAEFWDQKLKGLDRSTRVLDLACGAGSVLRRAEMSGFTNLTGADISQGAITALKDACPSAKGVVSPADRTPFDDEAFELVVSQFGFEYAGVQSVGPEIARILAPQGRFIALAHKSASVIEQEVMGKRNEAQSILDTGFIVAAKQLFQVEMTGGDDTAFKTALDAFRPAQDGLMQIARQVEGLAAHLYQGTQDLYSRRQAYALEDVIGWLDGMEGEVQAYLGRMESMIEAALTEREAIAFLDQLRALGLNTHPPEVFTLGPDNETVAWILSAERA